MNAISRYTKKRYWQKSWLYINLFFVACLLMSYLAPFVDPKLCWPIAFFGLLYLPLLAINIFFALTWLFKKPIFTLISIVAIVLNWGAVKAHFGLGFELIEEAVPQKDSLNMRIMSYNVRLFRTLDNTKNNPDSQDEIMAITQTVDPDILCFQEYYTRKKGKNDINALIQKELHLNHYFFHATAKNNYDSYGLAIFSKYPILRSGHLSEFENGVNSIIYIDILNGSDTLRIFNVHLRSFGFQKEDYEFINKSNTSLGEDVENTKRIGSRIKAAYQIRSEQVRAFRKHLEKMETPYIIAGDFNDTPLSFAVNHIGKNLNNAFKTKGRGWGKTYNGDFPNFQIDYIFTSPMLTIKNFRIIPKKLSDHYSVWADIQTSEITSH